VRPGPYEGPRRPEDQALKNPSRRGVLLNGAKRIRTADPLHAMQVLYQLSYGPDETH
jgi:hypothetical protein